MPKGESLYHKFPDYRVDLNPNPKRIHVTLNGHTLADTRRSLTVLETKHAPVTYIPREDVRMEFFEPSEHHTLCPFKGEASYFSARVGDQLEENVVWTYEDPFDEVAGLRDFVSFYTDRVTLSSED